ILDEPTPAGNVPVPSRRRRLRPGLIAGIAGCFAFIVVAAGVLRMQMRSSKMDQLYSACGGGDGASCEKAIPLLRSACDGGSGVACTRLGRIREKGLGGTPHDETEARALFQRACTKRSGEGCDLLGRM